MENKCDCSQCANWDDCEIKMVVHNPHQYSEEDYWVNFDESNSCGLPIPRPIKPDYTIKKGDKIGQLILKRHEGYLLP